uniref:Twin-arginine translocation signal domain-containing protein n=1 Tax=Eiseniibacteriota bacterium TaxID=2212470 RepID=A0A832MMX9_UNCEI
MSRTRPLRTGTRRAFLRAAGLAGLAAAAAPGAALARARRAPRAPATKPAPPAPPGAEAPPSADALALAAILERRHGAHLDRAQLEALTRDLERMLQSGQRLRAVRLANADEPDTVFGA